MFYEGQLCLLATMDCNAGAMCGETATCFVEATCSVPMGHNRTQRWREQAAAGARRLTSGSSGYEKTQTRASWTGVNTRPWQNASKSSLQRWH
mgnify:CR=1 FL=1